MTGSQSLLVVVLSLLLVACSKSRNGEAGTAGLDPARLTAATLGKQVVLPTDDYLQMPRYGNADMEAGRQLATQCLGCHSFEADGPHMAGPNLHGFFGRRVGSVGDYPYSPALSSAGFIWTPRALDAWLAQPAAFLPGNRMAYPGIRDADDRNALVAALLRLTMSEPRDND